MPDGQDKSDDLIAELAKLMSSGPGSPEPQAKPAPRLVTLPETPAPARPAGIRIPGMDAPVVPPAPPAPRPSEQPVAGRPAAPPVGAPESQPAADRPVSPASATPAAATPPAATPAGPPPSPTPFTLRIPGMETPVPVPAPQAPAAERPASAPAQQPSEMPQRPAAASSWKDREIPRAPEPRSTVERKPELRMAPATPGPRPEMPPPLSMPAPKPEPQPEPEAEAQAPENAATEDALDFDFGFNQKAPRDGNRPAPDDPMTELLNAADEPTSPPVPEPAKPSPAKQEASGDAIADLIAAELDAMDMVTRPAGEPRLTPPVAPARIAEARPRTSTPLPPRPAQSRTTPPPQESDRFAVAPMFGPASRGSASVQAPTPQAQAPAQPPVSAQPAPPPAAEIPVAPVPTAERDPMDEIESLIGEAVRVELTGGDRRASSRPIAPPVTAPEVPPQQPAAPVVPPLTTGFAPRRAAIKDAEPSIPASEAAILAAAAAVSAEIGSVEPMIAAQPAARPKAKPERRGFSVGMRQYVGMAVAGVLLVVALFGLYWVLGMNHGGDTEAPVLEADATPSKEAPPATATSNDTQGSVVFNELDGTKPTGEETLVSRDDSADTPIADVAQPVGDDTSGSESELANRKVRTVTVRPDGSIVNGDDAVAGSEALPVDRPNVPTIAGADVQPSELLASVPSDTASVSSETPATNAAEAVASINPSPGAVLDPTIVAPIPMARPRDRSAMVGGSKWKASASAAAPAASASQSNVSTSNGAYAQLSSQKTIEDAQNSLTAAQRKLGRLLGGASLEIRRVDLGARGVWYRVVLPTNSFQDATQACATIKANGSDCVPNG